HPADLACGHAHHQRKVGHVFVDHRAGAHEGIAADGGAAYDGAVCAQGRALAHERVAVFALAFDGRARVVDVGEHHARAAEYVVFQDDVVVYRHVVLDFYAVADAYPVAHVDVLAQRAAVADRGAGANVHPVPDAAVGADAGAFVHDGGGMNGCHGQSSGRGTRTPSRADR